MLESLFRAYWIVNLGSEGVPGNSSTETVPETDTGGQVEYTKALERTMLKELGKLHA